MKKSDLRSGMRLETGEDMYILIDDVYIDMDGGHLELDMLDDSFVDEEEPVNGRYQIQRIFESPNIGDMFNFDKKGPLLWEKNSPDQHLIKGKKYSEETIHLALKAYIGD